jgi:hypothetical protein
MAVACLSGFVTVAAWLWLEIVSGVARQRRQDSSAKGNALVTQPHRIFRPERAKLGRVSPLQGWGHGVLAWVPRALPLG